MNYIASLPWYDLNTTQASLDQFWLVLRDTLREHRIKHVPSELLRNTTLQNQWALPQLLLSQCCGPDLFTSAAQQLVPIARPVFSDLDCEAGSYFSHIVSSCRYNGGPANLVVNSPSSRSGNGALLEWTEQRDIKSKSLSVSGSHQSSLQAIRNDSADLAAIDAHSWNLLQVNDLRVIGRSTEALAPPYVMHNHNRALSPVLLQALCEAIDQAGHLIAIESVIATQKTDYDTGKCTPIDRDGILCGGGTLSTAIKSKYSMG